MVKIVKTKTLSIIFLSLSHVHDLFLNIILSSLRIVFSFDQIKIEGHWIMEFV